MHWRGYPVFINIALAVLSAVNFSAVADWDTETIESQLGYDTYVPLVLDTNDTPSLAYFDNKDGDDLLSITYRYFNGICWAEEVLEDNQLNNTSPPQLCHAIDSNGNHYLCYSDAHEQLAYNCRAGSTWSDREVVEQSGTCLLSDMSIDSNNTMHVVYLQYFDDWNDANLIWIHGSGTAFADPNNIAENGNYQSASLAIDSSNNPHVSYYDEDEANDLLIYAVRNGDSWDKQTVAHVGDVSSYIHGAVSLALDSNDFAHISYYDFISFDLKYAQWDDAGWNIQIVDDSNTIGECSSLVLDSDNKPRIAYQDKTNGILKYAVFDGELWQNEIVDDTNSPGKYASLALDSNDRAHISHFETTSNSVLYAAANPACGDSEYPPPQGDLDENCIVDFNDFGRFANWWLITGCADFNDCQGRDFDGTGTVDTADLETMYQNWLNYTGP